MASTRELVKDVVEGQVMRYCLQNSKLPIRKVEFTGSAYEGLQTDAAEKVSVMVVLKTTKSWLWWQEVETIHLCTMERASKNTSALEISQVCRS